jgi:hypothetical protein
VSIAAEAGQASVELVAGALTMVLTALISLQLLAAGYAAVMAGHAAEAGALAVADGRAAGDAARAAVPGWPERATRVRVEGNAVVVTLVPPSPLGFLRERLSVTGRAVSRRPAEKAERWDR